MLKNINICIYYKTLISMHMWVKLAGITDWHCHVLLRGYQLRAGTVRMLPREDVHIIAVLKPSKQPIPRQTHQIPPSTPQPMSE